MFIGPMSGDELKALRRDALRLRQKEMATLLGASPTTISEWERGKRIKVPQSVAFTARLMAKASPDVMGDIVAELRALEVKASAPESSPAQDVAE